MKYPCVEKTIDLSITNWQFRLWINCDNFDDEHWQKSLEEAEKILTTAYRKNAVGEFKNWYEMFEYIIPKIPSLNAIQIKNESVGMVVYTVDFSSEIHG